MLLADYMFMIVCNWTGKNYNDNYIVNNGLCKIKNDCEIEFIVLPYTYDLAQCIKIKMYKT